MNAALNWCASVFDSHVTPGDAVIWILLASGGVLVAGLVFRLIARWDEARGLTRHERASQTTTWVLVVVVVSLVAMSSILAMLAGLA